MTKQKILFFHFDLGNGGAERVLINLVNALDPKKYDITVKTLYKYGVNKDLLKPHVTWQWVFNHAPIPGLNKLLTLFPPRLLHRLWVREHYDVEIAFLEGSVARVISGCPDKTTRLFAWIHVEISDLKRYFKSFRSLSEASKCYHKFHKIAFVSENTRTSFISQTGWKDLSTAVVHNVLDVDEIKSQASQPIPLELDATCVNLCSIGRLNYQKGYDRLFAALARLCREGVQNWHFYLLGQGEEKAKLEDYARENGLEKNVSFLGYIQKPYNYLSKMDAFVCSSRFEGYSTAVTEAVLLQLPVITTECSGMKEILGEDYPGIYENSEEGIFTGLKCYFSDPIFAKNLKKSVTLHSSAFSTASLLAEFTTFIND